MHHLERPAITPPFFLHMYVYIFLESYVVIRHGQSYVVAVAFLLVVAGQHVARQHTIVILAFGEIVYHEGTTMSAKEELANLFKNYVVHRYMYSK